MEYIHSALGVYLHDAPSQGLQHDKVMSEMVAC